MGDVVVVKTNELWEQEWINELKAKRGRDKAWKSLKTEKGVLNGVELLRKLQFKDEFLMIYDREVEEGIMAKINMPLKNEKPIYSVKFQRISLNFREKDYTVHGIAYMEVLQVGKYRWSIIITSPPVLKSKGTYVRTDMSPEIRKNTCMTWLSSKCA